MTPAFEQEYMAFVNNLGIERSMVTGETDPRTSEMSFTMLHMAMGMCTEAGEVVEIIRDHTRCGSELNVMKLKDELGDLFFYLCGAIIDTNLSVQEIFDTMDGQEASPFLAKFFRDGFYHPQFNVPNPRLLNATMDLVVATSRVVDLLKKHMAYHRKLDFCKIKQELGFVLMHLADACISLNSNFDEIVTMNMAKLKKRYPSGYSHQNANNRDRKAEDEAQQTVTNTDSDCAIKGD